MTEQRKRPRPSEGFSTWLDYVLDECALRGIFSLRIGGIEGKAEIKALRERAERAERVVRNIAVYVAEAGDSELFASHVTTLIEQDLPEVGRAAGLAPASEGTTGG